MPSSIGDFIKSLLGMQPQGLAPKQAGPPAPYQPPGGGTLLEALGIPLALFGAYEAARGRPIGAPAGLLGAGLGYLGNQRNSNATAYSAFEAALQAAQKRAPVGAGVQEQLKALEPVGQADPTEGINETKDVLKQYFEQQKANQEKVTPELNSASMLANSGKPFDKLTTDAEREKARQMYMRLKEDPAAARIAAQEQARMREMEVQNQNSMNRLMLMQAGAERRMYAHEAFMRENDERKANAKDAKDLAKLQKRSTAHFTSILNAKSKEGISLIARSKDPKFPQALLSGMVDTYNDSVEELNREVEEAKTNGDLPPNYRSPLVKKLQLGDTPGGSYLSWIPIIGSKFPTHGTVSPESGGASGDID